VDVANEIWGWPAVGEMGYWLTTGLSPRANSSDPFDGIPHDVPRSSRRGELSSGRNVGLRQSVEQVPCVVAGLDVTGGSEPLGGAQGVAEGCHRTGAEAGPSPTALATWPEVAVANETAVYGLGIDRTARVRSCSSLPLRPLLSRA
jgi:hypothetical protein